LNGPFTYSATGVTDNQLRTLNHLGLLNPPLNEPDITNFPKLVTVTNATASLEDRVRSYAAANCAQCHRPGGVARANWDARYETPLLLQNIVNGPLTENLGVAGARVVAPGSLTKSILYQRINTVAAIKMPPLARNRIDSAAAVTFANWINTLPQTGNNLGLRGEYYDHIDLTGFKFSRTDEVINFDWGYGSPNPVIGSDTFSARWTGLIEPRFSESYTFYTSSDDGVRLWIDGQLIINNWTDHALTEDAGTISLHAGQKYPLRLEYYENGGQAAAKLDWSSVSQPREFIPPSQFTPDVGTWLDRDIGGVGIAGGSTRANSNFTVSASGADIWDYADGFHFVYSPLVGDGQILARVVGLQNSDIWAKAGVMIRESLDADSTHAFMAITAGNGAAFQRRPAQGALSLHTAGPAVTVPYWVQLVRSGTNFTASISSNGVNWVTVGSAVIPMNSWAFAGLAVTAHNNGVLNNATFSNVTMRSFGFPAPKIISAARLDNSRVQLQITTTNAGTYVVHVSNDLKDWLTLVTLVGSNGAVSFIDTRATNSASRFYRVLGMP
jgi:hypothetical protein